MLRCLPTAARKGGCAWRCRWRRADFWVLIRADKYAGDFAVIDEPRHHRPYTEKTQSMALLDGYCPLYRVDLPIRIAECHGRQSGAGVGHRTLQGLAIDEGTRRAPASDCCSGCCNKPITADGKSCPGSCCRRSNGADGQGDDGELVIVERGAGRYQEFFAGGIGRECPEVCGRTGRWRDG